MKIKIKISYQLYKRVLDDLRRPHPVAAERVGFLRAKLGNRGGTNLLVFLTDYAPVPDANYIEDHKVGARIDSAAIVMAMQQVLDTQEGIFHVHLHDWKGVPRLSWTDRREIPPIIESCRNLGRNSAHGIFVLSADKATAMVWAPNTRTSVVADTISVIGHPLRFLEQENGRA